MSDIIRPTNLTVKTYEICNLNNVNRNSANVIKIVNVSEINRRVLSVGLSVTSLVQFETGGAGFSKHVPASVKYIRITNLDDTNYIDLTASDHTTPGSAGQLFAIRLGAGKTFMLGSTSFNAATSDGDNSIAASDTIQEITGIANTAACDIEMYIAS